MQKSNTIQMFPEEQIYSIALSLCDGIGHVGAKRLVDAMGSATDVFARRQEIASLVPEIRASQIEALNNVKLVHRAKEELVFARQHGIRCLTLTDEAYPSRLRECDDAPVVLFFKGEADLNKLRVVAMVGTRNITEYGKDFCTKFVRELAALCPDVLIVSGLAYGVDIHSHREAMNNRLCTVAVLAHGLDRIYPYVHRHEAEQMQENGGLLTEFLTDTNPDRQNFVQRNRIVAGMSDAVVVVESAAKGGSLITAGLANDYNRECFAVPGRINDPYSIGCNQLIIQNKATLLQSAEELVKAMGWKETRQKPKHVQRDLFPDFTEEEEKVVNLLAQRGDLNINTLVVSSGIPINRMSNLLFELEIKGVIRLLAGGSYHLM